MAKDRDALSLVRPHLLQVKAYAAAEPPEALAERAGVHEADIVKLNANENPYGASPHVQRALANLGRVPIYPDPEQTAVRQALGRYVGIGPEHIVAGNGSDEIIDLLFRVFLAPGDALINCTPTFGMYSFTAHVNDVRVVEAPRGDRFEVDTAAVLKAAGEGAKAVVLASPNNPTGNNTPLDAVERLLHAGVMVIIDEAYQEFGGESAVSLVAEHPNLAVLRTLSKWAALAGLRVGYGVMGTELTELLMRIKPPYSVSQAAEAALLASLKDVVLLREWVGMMVEERERMSEMLASVPGVQPWPSSANFILCQLPEGRGQAVYEGLARRGVFVRYFSHPRLRDCVRISVGLPQHTDRLMEALDGALRDAVS
jgi:histidinol-phosphate aminotransferase